MSAEQKSGAEMLIRALKDQGVDVIFGYPGGAVLPIYDALFQQNALRHILVRHEQAAVHAAEGYARSTGKVGVTQIDVLERCILQLGLLPFCPRQMGALKSHELTLTWKLCAAEAM